MPTRAMERSLYIGEELWTVPPNLPGLLVAGQAKHLDFFALQVANLTDQDKNVLEFRHAAEVAAACVAGTNAQKSSVERATPETKAIDAACSHADVTGRPSRYALPPTSFPTSCNFAAASPLDHLRYELEPSTASDLALTSQQWSSSVVAVLSGWIDPDCDAPAKRQRRPRHVAAGESATPVAGSAAWSDLVLARSLLSAYSIDAFEQQMQWAAHLGPGATLCPPPSLVECSNYARLIASAIDSPVPPVLWVRIPLTLQAHRPRTDSAVEGPTFQAGGRLDTAAQACAPGPPQGERHCHPHTTHGSSGSPSPHHCLRRCCESVEAGGSSALSGAVCNGGTWCAHDGPVDGWHVWNSLRSMCDHPSGDVLGVALEFSRRDEVIFMAEELAEALRERWVAEPVKAVILPSSVFLTNPKGFPVLSRRHKGILLSLFGKDVQVILQDDSQTSQGAPGLCTQAEYPELPGPAAVEVKPAALSLLEPRAKLHSLSAMHTYVSSLFQKVAPLSSAERYARPFWDYLQMPLQPLHVRTATDS
eukprot:GHVT01002174.1.p1 GENE.GHVT01002174.1~~GHVT01002174.1.p1  ORF type:complete len:534 (+),score=91.83 GHVT01002174.1:787-2388(+)